MTNQERDIVRMSNQQSADAVWSAIREIVESRPEGTTIGVSVRHLATGETFAINGEGNFPSASTIKILILAGLARAFDEGRLTPTDKRSAPEDLRLDGSGVMNWLDPELQLTLRNHAWLMTAISDNTTSNVCIDAVGIDEINAVGTELGAGETRLGRKFMGSNAPSGPSKNRSTADGLVAILTAIEEDRAASPGQCAWMRQCLADQQHRDRLPRHLPDNVSYAGKTGTIHEIVHDCGVLSGPGGKIAIAVLTQGFTSDYDAERLIGKIGTAAAQRVATT